MKTAALPDRIDPSYLRHLGACGPGIEWFSSVFPGGCDLTVENLDYALEQEELHEERIHPHVNVWWLAWVLTTRANRCCCGGCTTNARRRAAISPRAWPSRDRAALWDKSNRETCMDEFREAIRRAERARERRRLIAAGQLELAIA